MLNAISARQSQTFFDLLSEWKASKSIGTDDLLSAVRPLFEQVLQTHNVGLVAPLDGVGHLSVYDDRELGFDQSASEEPRTGTARLLDIELSDFAGAFEVSGEVEVVSRDDGYRVMAAVARNVVER